MDGKTEKRMADSYEIIQSVPIGDREVVFGIDETKEMPYLCGFYSSNVFFASYEECKVCDDYVEAVELFADCIREQCKMVRREWEKVTVPREKITAKMCLPLAATDGLEGKVLAVKPEMIKPEYRTAEHQLVYVYGGNGARGGARGSACLCTNLYDGRKTRWERFELLGEVRPECLPQWAKEKAGEIRSQEAEQKSKNTIEIRSQKAEQKSKDTTERKETR